MLINPVRKTVSEDTNIFVVDSIMGSGKTSWAIQHMNQETDKKFIYITPFLDEVERVKKSVTSKSFKEPLNKGKGKLDNLKKLLVHEENIVSTHALFQMVDDEVIALLKATDYVLILDEAMNVLEKYPLKKDDFSLMVDSGMVLIDEGTSLVQWNDSTEYQDTQYGELKLLSQSGNLVYINNTVLYWTFPVQAFRAFCEVYVLTYLFQAQQQKYYFDIHRLNYTFKTIEKEEGKYRLIDASESTPDNKSKIRSLINIYDGRLNTIGENYSLSYSWYGNRRNAVLIKKMKGNVYTYFKNNTKTSAQQNMWTCYKMNRDEMSGKGYTKGFVSHNARSTNSFQHKESLAYTINRFVNPYEVQYFMSKGIVVDQDMFALSELIQWIWRSRIRIGKPINLYIPSKRMRDILQKYLNNTGTTI